MGQSQTSGNWKIVVPVRSPRSIERDRLLGMIPEPDLLADLGKYLVRVGAERTDVAWQYFVEAWDNPVRTNSYKPFDRFTIACREDEDAMWEELRAMEDGEKLEDWFAKHDISENIHNLDLMKVL